ncbi:5-oxoprolinase subunit PxpB [Dyella sp.]|jgi:inhibitor of KinA|uniref:5-oxoprolinase subunit PxpB n=1 Tax=Dyella sp. TaxID=1869338 RepID=UPI002FDAF5F6
MQAEPLAEDAWLLRFGDTIDAGVNARVLAAAARLQAELGDVECVPAYASLLLRFDPARWLDDEGHFSARCLRDAIGAVLQSSGEPETASREVTIPVCYGGAAGEDLHAVAAHAQLSADEVIARHTGVTYRVAMLGFAPGFPYLLGLDPALAMPRRSHPRIRVPAGSVAIGGQQTGIYPQALPGGWQLIGRTPLRLFDVAAEQPSLVQPGDYVRFQAIDEREYRRRLG